MTNSIKFEGELSNYYLNHMMHVPSATMERLIEKGYMRQATLNDLSVFADKLSRFALTTDTRILYIRKG